MASVAVRHPEAARLASRDQLASRRAGEYHASHGCQGSRWHRRWPVGARRGSGVPRGIALRQIAHRARRGRPADLGHRRSPDALRERRRPLGGACRDRGAACHVPDADSRRAPGGHRAGPFATTDRRRARAGIDGAGGPPFGTVPKAPGRRRALRALSRRAAGLVRRQYRHRLPGRGRAARGLRHRGRSRLPVAGRGCAVANPGQGVAARQLCHPELTEMRRAITALTVGLLLTGPVGASAQIFAPRRLDRYFRIEWQVTRDKKGPAIEGYVYNTAAQTAERMRLRIDRVDASGGVVGNSSISPHGACPKNNRAYFSATVPEALSYRVQALSFDWSCNGGCGGV